MIIGIEKGYKLSYPGKSTHDDKMESASTRWSAGIFE